MNTVADVLTTSSMRMPESVAIISGELKLTHSQLLNKALVAGHALQKQGLRQGDRIMTCLQNHHDAVLLYWASQLYGFVICPVNWRSTSADIDYFLTDCDAHILFFDQSSAEAVSQSKEAQQVISVEVYNSESDTQWQEMLECTPGSPPSITEDDLSVILYTSGTTGRPKGVLRTHRAERAASIAHIAQNLLASGEIALGVMPLYHTMGVRILVSTCLLSGTFLCQPKFAPEQTLRLIESHDVSSLYLVPTLYHDLIKTLTVHPADLSSVQRIGFAGASMSDGLLRKVSKTFSNSKIVNHYGSSEIYTYTVDQDAARKPGSAGKQGLNSQMAIIPIGSGDVHRTLNRGSEGQIIARFNSEESFSGYLHKPQANDAAIKDGWYLTGDVGYFDDEGDLFITGRVDDMIVTGGENLMPVEVESVLSLYEGVAEAVVVGKPDERLGSKVVAFIVADKAVGAEELNTHCRNSGLPGFKCPRSYQFIASIPKSPVGKILRRAL